MIQAANDLLSLPLRWHFWRGAFGEVWMASLSALWLRVRGIQPPLPPLRGEPPALDVPDSDDIILPPDTFEAATSEPPEADDLAPIAGVFIEIEYRDARGIQTARRITCRDFRQPSGALQLRAHCHERGALRAFRLDRIQMVVDPETGEVFAPETFFSDYVAAFPEAVPTPLPVAKAREPSTAVAAFNGLSAAQRYDLLAGLKVLAFLAHCDADWHPFEDEEISNFIWAWWAAQGSLVELDITEIMGFVRRLRPRSDDFFVSLKRASRNRRLGDLLLRAVTAVVEADGEIHSAEHRWVCELHDYLQDLVRGQGAS
jgi:hypothetical protein